MTLEQVSPRYIEALLGYEDRYFWRHPGVNPVAMVRGIGQWLRYGRAVSGGSTLTMQVARLIEPYHRSVPGKLRQMARALQLECNKGAGGHQRCAGRPGSLAFGFVSGFSDGLKNVWPSETFKKE